MNYNIQFAACTHPGRVRKNNEDNYYVNGVYKTDPDKLVSKCVGTADDSLFLAAVCDGMGGIEYGEIASLYAVESLIPAPSQKIKKAARLAVSVANNRICEEIRRKKGVISGSTMTALYIDDKYALVSHIGDSRCYLYRNNILYQLTRDHSRARSLVEQGILTEEQARVDKTRHQLTRYLGIFPEEMELSPEFSEGICLMEGDRFILCSDGLTDMLEDAELEEYIKERKKPEEQVKEMVSQALKHGGKDNITCVVLHVRKNRQ